MAIPDLPVDAFSGGARVSDGFLQTYLEAMSAEVLVIEAQSGVTANTVVVSTPGHLPTPSGGEIELDADTLYWWVGTVDVGPNTVVLQSGTVIQGIASRYRDRLISSAPGPAIRMADAAGNAEIRHMRIVASSIVFDIEARALILTASIISGTSIGNLRAAVACVISSVSFVGFGTGLTFTGSNGALLVTGTQFIQAAGGSGNACVDLGTATFNEVSLNMNGLVTAVGGVGLKGAAASGNVPSGRAIVAGVTFNGAGGDLATITVDDLRWSFAALTTAGVLESVVRGSFHQTPGSQTLNVDGPTILPLVTVAGTEHRIEYTGNNELTYRALQTRDLSATLCVGVEKTGSAVDIDVGIAVNGTLVAESPDVEIDNKRKLLTCTFDLPDVVAGSTIAFGARSAASVNIGFTGASLMLRP